MIYGTLLFESLTLMQKKPPNHHELTENEIVQNAFDSSIPLGVFRRKETQFFSRLIHVKYFHNSLHFRCSGELLFTFR